MDYVRKAQELGTVDNIMEWVRDTIKYQFISFISTKRTLKVKEGMCWAKTDVAVHMCKELPDVEKACYVSAAIKQLVPRLNVPPIHCHPRIYFKDKNVPVDYEISIDSEAISGKILPYGWENISKKEYERIPIYMRILLIIYPFLLGIIQKLDLHIRIRRAVIRSNKG